MLLTFFILIVICLLWSSATPKISASAINNNNKKIISGRPLVTIVRLEAPRTGKFMQMSSLSLPHLLLKWAINSFLSVISVKHLFLSSVWLEMAMKRVGQTGVFCIFGKTLCFPNYSLYFITVPSWVFFLLKIPHIIGAFFLFFLILLNKTG